MEQLARFKSLRLQSCDEAGKAAWAAANAIHQQLPNGVRIDLPSWRVFARVLGLYRSGASLSSRPMTVLELSAAEIASLVGYSKSVVEAALRWLGSEPITYFGLQLAHGLRYIERSRRKAKAFLAGVFREVYRTSKSRLTAIGGALVGVPLAEEKPSPCRAHGRRRKKPANPEGQAPDPIEESEPDWEANMRGLRRVLMSV